MWCEKCGRLTLFKTICASCAREQQKIRALEAGASPSPSTASPQVRTRTVVHGNVKLRLTGQDVTFDVSKGLTDEVLDDVVAKLKISRDRARQILEPQLSPDRIAALTKAALEGETTSSFATVNCEACHSQVSAGPSCSHCGAPLPGCPAR